MASDFGFGSAYTQSFADSTILGATNSTAFDSAAIDSAAVSASASASMPAISGYGTLSPIETQLLRPTYTIQAPTGASALLAAAPAPTPAPAVAIAAPAAAALPLDQYQLNVDPNPEVIRKKPAEKVQYTQQISLKFLKPPPPQQPGDIVIKQEKDVQAPPAPPLLVRQKPPAPLAPAPLVVRERPPAPPAPIPPKLVVVPGKVIPPPPRKVIVERLPVIPPPPQNIHVERWLGYNERVRRVVFQPAPKLIPAPAPKNVLIQWESPDVALNRDYKFLGVAPASPADFVAQFGATLVEESQLPALAVSNFRAPAGEVLGAHWRPSLPKLVGDLHALALIDLDAAGLSEYKGLIPHAAPVAIALPTATASGYATSGYAASGYASTY